MSPGGDNNGEREVKLPSIPATGDLHVVLAVQPAAIELGEGSI